MSAARSASGHGGDSEGGAQVVASLGALAAGGWRAGVLSIGAFDGVHLGHRTLLTRMRELGAELGAATAVVTFFPPAKVLFGGSSYLSSASEKLELLAGFDPDAVAMIPFTRTYAQTPKSAFIAELARLEPRVVIVGEDFRFGHRRSGGLADLRVPGRDLEVFGLVTHDGEPVKSTRIRAHLDEGEIAAANALLGAPYRATGTVVTGDRRGRTVGFPTANVGLEPEKALPLGVFAVTVDTPRGGFGGMANVGPRPSFPDGAPALEAHLFDFDGDLYGREVRVRFHAFLRRQRRFTGLDDLTAQLRRDRQQARAALAERGLPDG